MKTQKLLVGTLVGGVALFFLGWIIYGMMLSGYMAANCDQTGARPMEQMVMWAMVVSNLVWGLLLTVVMDWAGSNSIGSGAKVGAILGTLSGLAMDMSMYSMTTMFLNPAVIFVDTLCYGVMFAITGSLIGIVTGKMGQAKT